MNKKSFLLRTFSYDVLDKVLLMILPNIPFFFGYFLSGFFKKIFYRLQNQTKIHQYYLISKHQSFVIDTDRITQ